MAEKKEPVFVNLQSSPVSVYSEVRARVTVLPWAKKGKVKDGIFEVRGDHYAQFVGPRGPLFPRPAPPPTPGSLAKSSATPEGASAASAAANAAAVAEADRKAAEDKSAAGGEADSSAVTPPTDWHTVEKGAAVTAEWRDKKWNGAFVSPVGEDAQKLRIKLDGDDAKYREVPVRHVKLIQFEV